MFEVQDAYHECRAHNEQDWENQIISIFIYSEKLHSVKSHRTLFWKFISQEIIYG